jgi:hypothetical protein
MIARARNWRHRHWPHAVTSEWTVMHLVVGRFWLYNLPIELGAPITAVPSPP